MSPVELVVTIFSTAMASSGFWAWIASRKKVHDSSSKLLLGLAHDRIVSQGMYYIQRGWITFDEYEDYMKYLCEPYMVFGGNGMAERVVEQVQKLNVVPKSGIEMELKENNHDQR